MARCLSSQGLGREAVLVDGSLGPVHELLMPLQPYPLFSFPHIMHCICIMTDPPCLVPENLNSP